MKAPHWLRPLVLGGLLVVLAGCGTSTMSWIDANRAEYESWPIDVRQAVLDKRVIAGMTPRQVEVVAGKPAQIIPRSNRKGTQEVWIYQEGGGGLGNVLGGTAVGVGVGGVGVTTGGLGGGAPRDSFEVVFENGVVVSTTQP